MPSASYRTFWVNRTTAIRYEQSIEPPPMTGAEQRRPSATGRLLPDCFWLLGRYSVVRCNESGRGNSFDISQIKPLIYDFAMWVNAAFHLKVIRAYD